MVPSSAVTVMLTELPPPKVLAILWFSWTKGSFFGGQAFGSS